MDLSWCIICDRHSIEDNLYCSEYCRMQDVKQKSRQLVDTPPTSPLLNPYFSSFNHDRRTSITLTRNVPRYNL